MNIDQAVQDSMNSTYGYFYYDYIEGKVQFQPTQGPNDRPAGPEWGTTLSYLGKPFEFATANERKIDLIYLLEFEGVMEE